MTSPPGCPKISQRPFCQSQSRHIAGPIQVPRFVPQAYQPQEITQLRALGYPEVIWTLYAFGSDGEVIRREAKAHQPAAIAMPVDMARSGLLAALSPELDIPLYVHTVNERADAACFFAMGAAGLYSDELVASDLGDDPEPDGCESVVTEMR